MNERVVLGRTIETVSLRDELTALAERLKSYSWNVFIDGPADAGKGTACNYFTEYLGLEKIETGNMYRAVVVWLGSRENLTNNLRESDYLDYKLVEALDGLKIDFRKDDRGGDRICLSQGEQSLDVTDEIEADWVNARISGIASKGIVRDKVEVWQSKLLGSGNKVIEGRDMWQFMRKRGVRKGLLVYIHATDEELAKREVERKEKLGMPVSYKEALQRIRERNQRDNQRKRGQLLTPDQAHDRGKYDAIIDTTNLSPEEVLLVMMKLMESKIRKRRGLRFIGS